MPRTPTEPQSMREAYFARVAPLYGTAWEGLNLGLDGGACATQVALLLARCGLRQFVVPSQAARLAAELRRQNPYEDRYRVEARAPMKRDGLWLYGHGAARPKVAECWSVCVDLLAAGAVQARVDFFRPGERLPAARPVHAVLGTLERHELFYRVAALVRGWLLKDTGVAPAEATELLAPYLRPTILLGHARWPWWLRAGERADMDEVLRAQDVSTPNSEPRPGGRALVVGCGSLGSVAADAIAETFDEWVLLDPETVAIENPVRQAFPVDEVGAYKAQALAARLNRRGVRARGEVHSIEDSRAGAVTFGEWVDAWRPDAVLLSTGTGAEYAMARTLRARGIPHVAARCYARARYFEIVAVAGARGPCFHCLRERVHVGPAPALTPEQQARYDPDFRPDELNAEPATILDSGRCALASARVLLELARPVAARADWFAATLAQERTCLIGANHAERVGEGWAYGIDRPGAVVSYGLEDLAGVAPGERCEVCGKVLAPPE